MTRRARLDAELVRRGLARSRDQAAQLVSAGQVRVPGRATVKPATQVGAGDPIVVDESREESYVSRGGHKLAGALDVFAGGGLSVAGRTAVDAGASTGGFTDVLLRRGAARVVCVDVGYGQLAWSLQSDARVDVRDRTNVRELTAEAIGGHVDVVVADLSFISLRKVLPALASVVRDDGDLVVMVKPQFEVGRAAIGARGVVREPALRREAVASVAAAAYDLGLGGAGVTASQLPGPSGNVEYFLWLRRAAGALDPDALAAAVEGGPQ